MDLKTQNSRITTIIARQLTDWLSGQVIWDRSRVPCRFSGRFEDGGFSMKMIMKICSNLYWRMKMWRNQISGLLKSEDYRLPHLMKMNIAFLKLLKTKDLKTPLKNMKKMKTMSCAGSPRSACFVNKMKPCFIYTTFAKARLTQLTATLTLTW